MSQSKETRVTLAKWRISQRRCFKWVQKVASSQLSSVRMDKKFWLATPPVLLPGKSHGWRSLIGYSPWGHQELYTTERLHFPFSFSCIGERNGSPLQCSCLENPRDGGAWWAAVYGVTQSWTQLKRLSSSSSRLQKWSLSHWFHLYPPINTFNSIAYLQQIWL